MTDRELMQQVLDALFMFVEYDYQGNPLGGAHFNGHKAIEALRARLAQPEQEPINYEEWNYDPMTGKPLWGEQPEQEPVAWHYAGSDVEPNSVALDADLDAAQKANCIPLYAVPPQREWQGLTDEDIRKLSDDCAGVRDETEFIRAIEAKLKAKNAL